MPRKGDAKYGIQPREPVQVNGYDCLPARGGKAGGDDYTCASRTSQGTVASSSEDESEFVPSSTFLESGVLHIRGNGVVGNGDVPNNPITPQKLKNNTKKMQKRKIGTTECTPDTKRNKGTPAPAWTSRGDGYAKQDSDDASSCDDSDEHSTSGKDAAVEEDWVWKELDQRHFRFPSRKQLAFLETLDRDAMHTVASNQAFLSLASAIPSMLPMNGMSPLHVIDRPRRGRYYLDTWGELDFLDTLKSFGKDVQFDTSEFQVYTTNHDLVHQYDDDAFEDYVSRLEKAISPNAHLDERIHEYPASFGGCDGGGEMDAWTSQPELWVQRTSREPSEVDEVSDVMDMCIKALVNQSASNCHALRQVFDRVAQETELEPIFQQEKMLITEIETYYQRWRQTKAAFRSASVVSAWRTALKSQNFNAAQISAVEFATRFASTLQLGDGIDFLDHTGQWEPGFVVDLFVASCKLSSYAKIQLVRHGAVSQEWCCVFSGRIMPAGTNTQRAAPVLDIKIHPTPADDASVIVHHEVSFPKAITSSPPSVDAPLPVSNADTVVTDAVEPASTII